MTAILALFALASGNNGVSDPPVQNLTDLTKQTSP